MAQPVSILPISRAQRRVAKQRYMDETRKRAESVKNMSYDDMTESAKVEVRKTEAGKLVPDKGLIDKVERSLAESGAFGSPEKEKEY
jgi:hypothetical protein